MDSKISFVYFDLGNVIVNFDHGRIGENLSRITGVNSSELNDIFFEKGLQNRYESGELSTDEFVAEVNRMTQSKIPPDELCLAVSDIFWINRSTIPLITQLKSANVPIGILSNTCDAHWKFVLKRFPVIDRLFDNSRNILSYESRSMKPADKIYRDAIEATGMNARKIFFMDDRLENVVAAQANGIQSSVFQNAHQIHHELSHRGIKINF